MKKITYTYKCGCEWVSEFPMGCSKKEEKQIREKAKVSFCPKCERRRSEKQ